MAHKITCSKKDSDGDITGIGNSQNSWTKAQAIKKIDDEPGVFYVHQAGPDPVDVIVVDGATGRYLRTTPDKNSKNNLDNLPDCD